jgi:hypothetical protein
VLHNSTSHSPVTKTPIKYPRSRERLIVAEAAIRFGRAFNSELFGGYSASQEDATWVLLAVIIGHLSGRPMTTRRIARFIGRQGQRGMHQQTFQCLRARSEAFRPL